MALCIAYLCISSFSASFCKRNIIKIIMKIRFCELSSLGPPVFGALWYLQASPFELFPGQQLGIGSCRDPGDEPEHGMGLGDPQMKSGDPRWSPGDPSIRQGDPSSSGDPQMESVGSHMELRGSQVEHSGEDSPQTLQRSSCPLAAAGPEPSAPLPDPRAVPSVLGQPFLWGGLSNTSLQVQNLASSCSASSAHQDCSWAGPGTLQNCSSHPSPGLSRIMWNFECVQEISSVSFIQGNKTFSSSPSFLNSQSSNSVIVLKAAKFYLEG